MNALVKAFETRLETIKAWRHHLHQHPELSFEEVNTSRYIADLVKAWGYDVVEGIGKHGVVGSRLVCAPTPTPFQFRRTTTCRTRAQSTMCRIYAATTGTRRCCWRLANTWLGRETSTAPFG
jgi:hypothetical protein